ncbi:ABC transporter permease [uncultured Cohaesibacter sp.]|uniref:ABC transporter permease n=1 Tax=uncultured Cohaesibacter sp. TaxID=1002546 RepID=UPI0029C735FC|nr:ABC transporter permease [uncultured Cohaesibacter sp.]
MKSILSTPATGASPVKKPAWLVALGSLVVLVLINWFLQPSFFDGMVLHSNLTTFLPLILVAIGQTFVIMGGDIDLSVGSIAALVNVVTVTVIASAGGDAASVPVGLLAGLVVAVLCGIFNGLLISYLRLQPMVATFGTGIIFSALALWVMPQAGLGVPDTYWMTYSEAILGVPTVLWILIIAFLFVLVMQRRPFESHLKAVGGNRAGAFQSGIDMSFIRLLSFALCGLFSGFAALCLTGETASGDPLIGQSLAMGSISAVVLGGTMLSGGVGGAVGSILGALLLGMIGNVIFFAGLPFEFQTLVQGLIVLAALAGGVLVARK